MGNFDHVFTPFTFGPVTIKNRIEMPPAGYNLATYNGEATEDLLAYIETLAKGGAAIITLGETPIDESSQTNRPCLDLSKDSTILSLFKCNEMCAKYGAKLSIEIQHGGRSIRGRDWNIAPSAIYDSNELEAAAREGRPRRKLIEMDQAMIDQVVQDFAKAFGRCKKAGMEMAMLHGAHGHLIAQFLSPYSNHRTDNYGGSLKNRARFAIEVLDAIRAEVGRDFAIEYRISADELTEGGMKPEETIEFVKMIEDKIDLLHVSAGMCSSDRTMRYMIQPMYMPHNINVHYAEQFKKALKVPIVTVGSISTMEDAEAILAEGKADVVAMARAILADPQVVNNAKKDQTIETRPCLRCWKCNEHSGGGFPIRCAVNPYLAREMQMARIPAQGEADLIAIIGGGPAGMQTALSASKRGIKSVLFEKENELGGKLALAAGVGFKTDIKRYLEYLVRQVNKDPNIEIRLGTEATKETIAALNADALVIAIGADPILPHFRGWELNNCMWFGDVDKGTVTLGDDIVIVGGGASGAETALQLARDGKKVTIIDRQPEGLVKSRWLKCLDVELEDNNVDFIFDCSLLEVTEDGVKVMDKREMMERKIKADTVVLSLGFRPNKNLVQELASWHENSFIIGDCSKVGNILCATRDAFYVATQL